MVKKIVLVSGLPISINPRAKKEADVLASFGYEVEVIGAIYDVENGKVIHELLEGIGWKHLPVIDVSTGSNIECFRFLFSRIRRKFWTSVKKHLNFEAYPQLGYFPYEIYKLAKSRKADLYILHAEESLWAGCELLKDGFRVAVDIEDWYSEDGLPEDRMKRPVKVMKDCESFLLKKSVFSVTTSHSMSQALADVYHCLAPSVIYNSFPSEKSGISGNRLYDRKNLDIPSIIWFSLTIGPGRGLEELIAALNNVRYPFELHIRGLSRKGYCETLLKMADIRIKKNIHFHSQVSQKNLLSRLREHDIGYCGEFSDCLSRDLTVTNKMMEYLNAGLAIIATNTSGQKEIAEKVPEGVFIFEQKSIFSLTELLNKLLGDSEVLKNAKIEAITAFERYYRWENSGIRLKQLVSTALNHK